LTALETISRSKDTVGAHQKLNGSRDLTTLLTGTVCPSWTTLATINLSTKFEVSISTQFEDVIGDRTYRKWGGLG